MDIGLALTPHLPGADPGIGDRHSGALALAYLGGALTGKAKGLSDVTGFAGLALMGGTMMRDFCIVATASEVRVSEAKKAGGLGLLALLLGTSCRSSSAWASHGLTAT